jgi:hypothetical protein
MRTVPLTFSKFKLERTRNMVEFGIVHIPLPRDWDSNYYYRSDEESKERSLIKWVYSVRLLLIMVRLVLFRYRQF